MSTEAFGYAVTSLLMCWARNSKDELGKVSIQLLKHVDRQAQMDDRLDGAEVLLAA